MAKSDPNLLTQSEYARHRTERGLPGGSREAVRKAISEGRISAFGPDKLVDKVLADAQWERNTRTRLSPTSGAAVSSQIGLDASSVHMPNVADAAPISNEDADSNYMVFRARREKADAQIAEMNAAKMRGTMLVRQDVDRAMFEIAREIRDRLTACARRVAAEVSSLQTAEQCEAVIEREHRIVLELLVSTCREKIGAPVQEGIA